MSKNPSKTVKSDARIHAKGPKHAYPPHESLKSLKSGITYIQYLFEWEREKNAD